LKHSVKNLREAKNLTQSKLAEKSGLSLRTIQRIEAGSALKGFTLKAVAESLETQPEKLIPEVNKDTSIERAKLINLSALSGLVIPFAGIILPLVLTYNTADPKNKTLGKQIVSFQILLICMLSVLMIASPFIQKAFAIQFPLFLIFLIAYLLIKIFVIIRNGVSLNQNHELYISLKYSIL